jgi:hypothetical protein
MFFTLKTPSKTFDILGEEFSHVEISLREDFELDAWDLILNI